MLLIKLETRTSGYGRLFNFSKHCFTEQSRGVGRMGLGIRRSKILITYGFVFEKKIMQKTKRMNPSIIGLGIPAK